MVSAVLYCSYKGSNVGYRMALADMEKKELTSVISNRDCVPKSIRGYFSSGGANVVCGYDAENMIYFMLMKKIDLEDESKRFDEMGRKVYINIAFLSSDKNEMTALTKGFFSQYSAVEKAFTGLLSFDDGELGYTIDFELLGSVIKSSTALGNSSQCRNYVSPLYSSETTISFVSVDPSWEYFAKMCRLPLSVKPVKIVESKKLLSDLTGSSDKLFDISKKAKNETAAVIQKNPQPEKKTIPQPEKQPVTKPVSVSRVQTDANSQKPLPDTDKTKQDAHMQQMLYETHVKLKTLEDRLDENDKLIRNQIDKFRSIAVSAAAAAVVSALLSVISLIISIVS